jgi:hypothetical protein
MLVFTFGLTQSEHINQFLMYYNKNNNNRNLLKVFFRLCFFSPFGQLICQSNEDEEGDDGSLILSAVREKSLLSN